MQGVPKLQAFRPYLGVASTLLARTLFTMCSYTCITAAATSLGTPQAAAHQVTLQLFWFLSCKLIHRLSPGPHNNDWLLEGRLTMIACISVWIVGWIEV